MQQDDKDYDASDEDDKENHRNEDYGLQNYIPSAFSSQRCETGV